jgi:predicted transcriptional regulator
MYELALDMSLVDFAVKCAIRNLSDGTKPITAAEIARHIGCSDTTVRRNLPRLIEAGTVKRYGNKRKGYWYEVAEGNQYARSR